MLKIYVNICIFFTAILGYEYLVLNRVLKKPSIFWTLKKKFHMFKGVSLSPEAGKPLSYWFGWIGFGLMIIMLLYSLRKRNPTWTFLGSVSAWLDFHIFCGLLGPIFIIFHTNFKIGGLVAIAFWSMIVAAVSGIVGKYFHYHLKVNRYDLGQQISYYDQAFASLQRSHGYTEENIKLLKFAVVSKACSVSLKKVQHLTVFDVLWGSIKGDTRLLLSPPPVPKGLHPSFSKRLVEYGKLQRKILFLETYQRFMGYWHTFHFPFSIFMYIIATIHTITALMFKVN